MNPGIYYSLPNDQYHGGAGISKSGLDIIARSPLHFQHARSAANDNTPTAAQAIGSALHALVLEPHVFTQTYTMALRMADVPDAIDDRDQLVAMVEQLNATRLGKLPTTGSKAELVDRIIAGRAEMGTPADESLVAQFNAMTGAELKQELVDMNASREPKLTTSGLSRHDLATVLRANGIDVTLWSDVQAEWQQNNGHRTVLSADQWEQIHGMHEAILAHPVASALLNAPGVAEASAYWVDPVTGVLCRCRPDFWSMDGFVVDLKTTEDASPEGFAKSVAKWRYHVQDAYYRDGLKLALEQDKGADFGAVKPPAAPRAFVFIAVEKTAPYAVGVYVLDDDSKALGAAEYRRDLDTYAACMTSGQWPGYGDKIQKIGVPGYYLNKNVQLLEG